MPTPTKKRTTKPKKGKIKVSQRARVKKKSETRDAIPTIQGRMPPSMGATFKIKVRKK